jgi:hypothetical protein
MTFIELGLEGPLPDDLDRDDLEDELAADLGDDGEITGAGTALDRPWTHLDIELCGDVDRDEALHRIAGTLRRLGVAHLATLSLETGERIEVTRLGRTPR